MGNVKQGQNKNCANWKLSNLSWEPLDSLSNALLFNIWGICLQMFNTECSAVSGFALMMVCCFGSHRPCSGLNAHFTHQHDNTPVEDSPVVAVATGRAQERLLQDVTAAGKHRAHSFTEDFWVPDLCIITTSGIRSLCKLVTFKPQLRNTGLLKSQILRNTTVKKPDALISNLSGLNLRRLYYSYHIHNINSPREGQLISHHIF